MKKKTAIKAITNLNKFFDVFMLVSIIILSIAFVIYISVIVLAVLEIGTIFILEKPSLTIILPIINIILIIFSIIYSIYRRKKKKSNPDFRQDEAVQIVDERGISIEGKVSSASFNITIILLIATIAVTGLLGYYMVFFVTFSILCVSGIFRIIFEIYYNKKM
jgi:hypothetical protein